MSYQENEIGLVQLFQELHPVGGTFPPVYMLDDDILIGYDKLEQLRVITHSVIGKNEPSRTRNDWGRFLKRLVDQIKDRPEYRRTDQYNLSS